MQTFLTTYDVMDGYLIAAIAIYIIGILIMVAVAYHSPINHHPDKTKLTDPNQLNEDLP